MFKNRKSVDIQLDMLTNKPELHCKAKNINLNWLLYGDDYPKYTINRSL